MDGARFDDLVRRTLGGGSRRGILRAGLGSLAASGLATIGLIAGDDATAKKKKKKKKKKTSPPAVPPASPPPPVSPPPVVPPPPPTCVAVRQACPAGNCCAGLICDNNFCGGPAPNCCGALGATCVTTCDCCGITSFCDPATNTCEECSGNVCPSGECIDGDCCDGSDCGNPQLCENNTCVCVLGLKCGLECCQTDDAVGEVCHFTTIAPPTCQPGGCPTYDYCGGIELYTCGDGCSCMTSIEGERFCTDDGSAAECFPCALDSDCAGGIGEDAVCVEGGPFCNFCAGNFCIRPGCASAAPLGAQGRSGSFLRSRAKPSASANHKQPERGKSGHGARKQHNKRGRRH